MEDLREQPTTAALGRATQRVQSMMPEPAEDTVTHTYRDIGLCFIQRIVRALYGNL
jgi:hypothetical protein